MATNVRAQAQETDYEGTDIGSDEGAGGSGEGGQEEIRQTEGQDDAAFDDGQEQEVGEYENVDEVIAQPQTRGQNRFQTLSNENAELKRRLLDLEARNQPPPQQTQQYEETEEQFQARISLLPPDERMEAKLDRAQRRNAVQMHLMTMQAQDFADKAAFEAKAAVDGRFKRYADQVETELKKLRAQGQNVPREALLKYLIGERVLSGKGQQEVRRQQTEGQRRVARQQTRPSGGSRSDVQAGQRGTNEQEARRRRLDGMQI